MIGASVSPSIIGGSVSPSIIGGSVSAAKINGSMKKYQQHISCYKDQSFRTHFIPGSVNWTFPGTISVQCSSFRWLSNLDYDAYLPDYLWQGYHHIMYSRFECRQDNTISMQ